LLSSQCQNESEKFAENTGKVRKTFVNIYQQSGTGPDRTGPTGTDSSWFYFLMTEVVGHLRIYENVTIMTGLGGGSRRKESLKNIARTQSFRSVRSNQLNYGMAGNSECADSQKIYPVYFLCISCITGKLTEASQMKKLLIRGF
jgi:hypothetical protein